jgi:hypothetical protein
MTMGGLNENVAPVSSGEYLILVVIKLNISLVGNMKQMPLGSNKLGSLLDIDN